MFLLFSLIFVGCIDASSSPMSIEPNPEPLFGGAKISWDANSENDLAGYKVHWGLSSRNYENIVDVGNATSWSFWFDPGIYYFALTAYDFSQNESGYSAEVMYEEVTGLPPPTVPGDPIVEIEWRDTVLDTLTQTLLIQDSTVVNSLPLFAELKVNRESSMSLDSLQLDFNIPTPGRPVIGTVHFTKNLSGFWESTNSTVMISSGVLYAMNCRAHEKNKTWFEWPTVRKYFKIKTILTQPPGEPPSSEMLLEVISIMIILEIKK